MTKYTFIAENEDSKENIIVTITTEEEHWGTPVKLFQRFLQAQGFVFGLEEHIGFMDYTTDKFRDGSDW